MAINAQDVQIGDQITVEFTVRDIFEEDRADGGGVYRVFAARSSGIDRLVDIPEHNVVCHVRNDVMGKIRDAIGKASGLALEHPVLIASNDVYVLLNDNSELVNGEFDGVPVLASKNLSNLSWTVVNIIAESSTTTGHMATT